MRSRTIFLSPRRAVISTQLSATRPAAPTLPARPVAGSGLTARLHHTRDDMEITYASASPARVGHRSGGQADGYRRAPLYAYEATFRRAQTVLKAVTVAMGFDDFVVARSPRLLRTSFLL